MANYKIDEARDRVAQIKINDDIKTGVEKREH